MAKLSLQEQLLKSGLVSSAQAKQAKSEKNKQIKQQQKNNIAPVNESKLLAQQAQEAKLLKDKELNQLRKQEADLKALSAQIRELIALNRIDGDDEGLAYHFNDSGKVKTIYISDAFRNQLSVGRLAIVKYGNGYVLVSADIAHKIQARDANYFMVLNEAAVTSKADDPYAAYAIPDDLQW